MRLPVVRRREDRARALRLFEQQIANFQNALDRMFSDFWRGFPTPFGVQSFLDRSMSNGWWPKADISETDKEFRLKMDIPGVDPDKVKVETDDDILMVSGATDREEQAEGENWYRLERETGSFRRAFDLPSGVDRENIRASTKHGTLTIILPKKPETRKKKVPVEVKS